MVNKSTIELGSLAPDFRLFSSDKKEVALSSYRNQKKVLLLFLPLAFTEVCSNELCTVRDDLDKYNNLDTEVLVVFPDFVFVLEQVKNMKQVNYTLLSDFNREVSALYGVLYAEFPVFGMRNVPKRSAFVIDKAGVVRYKEVLENPKDLPNLIEIDKVLQKLS